jgi:Fic family protein
MVKMQMDLEPVITRVRNEFLEMPGLRLNISQAMRLWGLSRDECQRVIEALVKASFLQKTRRGEIVRLE